MLAEFTRLTLSKRVSTNRKIEIFLKIELSLPKLFSGNNFNELLYRNFEELGKKIVSTLADMGVATTAREICNAEVFAIHYSKNVELTDGSTPYHYINKIKEAKIKMSLHVNQTNYRNDGHSYRWHCNSYPDINSFRLITALVSPVCSIQKNNNQALATSII